MPGSPTDQAARGGAIGLGAGQLGGHRAASTLVTVPVLARPEWHMEVAAVAAN